MRNLGDNNMLKTIRKSLDEYSKCFSSMTPVELKEAEKELEAIEEMLTNTVFPRLLDQVEKDNPEYQQFKEQALFETKSKKAS